MRAVALALALLPLSLRPQPRPADQPFYPTLVLSGRDTYTNFSNPTMHVAPMSKFLERFRQKPLVKADAPLETRWAQIAPKKMATSFQPGTTKARKHRARQTGAELKKTTDVRPSSTETNESSKLDRPNLETLKARELKDLLRARNLDTRGTKAQLVSRLEEAYKMEL